MAVTVTNLTAGPGTLYTGAFGATEPADSAVSSTPSASTWTDMGGTDGGVTLSVEKDYMEFSVDQLIDSPGRRITKRDLKLSTNLVEPTLANLAVLLNGGTVTASASYSTYDLADENSATVPTYKAFIFDGQAPGSTSTSAFRRRVIARKALSIANVESAFKKDGQTMFPVQFACHYVSSVIKPFHYVDQTA